MGDPVQTAIRYHMVAITPMRTAAGDHLAVPALDEAPHLVEVQGHQNSRHELLLVRDGIARPGPLAGDVERPLAHDAERRGVVEISRQQQREQKAPDHDGAVVRGGPDHAEQRREDGVQQQQDDDEVELVVAVQGVIPQQRPRLVPRVAGDHREDPVDERPHQEGNADLHVPAAPEPQRRTGPGDLGVRQQEGSEEEEGRPAEVQEHDEGPCRRVAGLDVPQQRVLQHDGATGNDPERIELADVAAARNNRLVHARHGADPPAPSSNQPVRAPGKRAPLSQLRQGAAQVAHGLADALLVLDEGETDVAVPAGAEPDAG